MLGIFALHHLRYRVRCGWRNSVPQHVGECGLLAANQKQREKQSK